MANAKHFVLVHGAGHGAWCWYKIIPLLKSAGHRVTALDLSGCGVHPKQVHEVNSFAEYAKPLMDFMASLLPDEKVVLVGHSYGGSVISLAMENFADNVEVSIYVTAFMPNHIDPMASTLAVGMKHIKPETWDDTKVSFGNGPENPPTSYHFGPNYMAARFYQNCPKEDQELAKMLVREHKGYSEDLSKESLLTEERFGSVSRVFVVCEDDIVLNEEFCRWMIRNSPPKQVKSIPGADHMVMLSQPQQLCILLQEIVDVCHV